MKKKKGFTLVELLAVIVILAIILVIAVPQIMKTIDSARLGAFRSTAKLILTQAEKQHLVDQTLKVDEDSIGTTTYQGTGNGDNECGKLAKLGSDYSACKVKVDSNGKATLETLKGANKFANYSCTNATLNNVDNVCNKGESNSNPEQADTVAFVVSGKTMNIGSAIPFEVNARNNASEAMADWENIAGSTKPFYLKHELGDDVTVWCINGSDGSNSCDFNISLESQSECEDELQYHEEDGVTYSCSSQKAKYITESYVGFVVTEEMASVNEGMKAGTYYLKGGDSGESFIENMNKIKTAFDYANHPDRCYGNQTSDFNCIVSGLDASAYSDGHVNSNDYYNECNVGSDGFSYCGAREL